MRSHTQLCPTLCDPMDYSPPGSSVHGTFQARILEWVAISFSRTLFHKNKKLVFVFIYLTALGLSCSMWDLVP